MTVDVQKLPKGMVLIKATLDADEFTKFIGQATDAFTVNAELPGFRKGKAPANFVVSHVGEGKLLEEAANLAVREMHPKIVEEHKIEVIGRPEIRVIKLARGNPFEWELTITTVPEFTLPDYKAIAASRIAVPEESPAVTDAELTSALEWLQKSRRPEGDENVALPELNDEFAKSVGAFKNLEDLKHTIKANMLLEKQQKARDKRRMDILEAVVSQTKIETPETLVEAEKNKMLHELEHSVGQMGIKWDEYLAHAKKTVEDLRRDWQEDAVRRVRFGLVLREVAKREHLEPTDTELNTWADQYLMRQDPEARKTIDREALKDYAYGIIRNEHVFAFLENISSLN